MVPQVSSQMEKRYRFRRAEDAQQSFRKFLADARSLTAALAFQSLKTLDCPVTDDLMIDALQLFNNKPNTNNLISNSTYIKANMKILNLDENVSVRFCTFCRDIFLNTHFVTHHFIRF